MADDGALLEVLGALRERGALGEPSLDAAVAHAQLFVESIPPHAARLIDLGSGGGLPGLVIAARRPDLTVVLTDRRERRADLLRLACAQLGVSDRVSVKSGDVVRLGNDPEFLGRFDIVTARSFAAPSLTLSAAAPFLAPGGRLIVSEPPTTDPGSERWPAAELERLGMHRLVRGSTNEQRVALFERFTVPRETSD